MATILEFRSMPRAAGEIVQAGQGASAEIVLFPGVRYERQMDEGDRKPRKNSRGRDTLELEN